MIRCKKNGDSEYLTNQKFTSSLLVMIALHTLFFILYGVATTHYPNSLTTEDHSPRNNKIQKPVSEKIKTYEPGYPKISRVHWFPTSAAENEMARHDRYLIHGLIYTKMLTQEYIKNQWSFEEGMRHKQRPLAKKKICINIFMKNRALPYINSLVMTLMGSHEHDEKSRYVGGLMGGEGSPLLSHTSLNLFDTERHPDRLNYDDIRLDVMKLPFLNLRRVEKRNTNWSSASARLDKIQDYLTSAKVCVESNLQWCLMMEEYSVVPKDFLNLLKRFVTAPMESLALAHSTPGDADTFLASKFSFISLFSAFDWNSRTPLAVHNPEYSKKLYDFDRAKLNSERKSLNLKEYHAEYDMYPISNADYPKSVGESNVALLFTTFNVKTKLIPFLLSLEKEEERKVSGGHFKLAYEHRIPELNLELEFAKYTGIKQYQVEPSLVNRIGFYDEDLFNYDHFSKHRLGITNWYTDPRFLFEGGEYWEGISTYCQTKDGKWYYDKNYYNDKPSYCDEASDE